MRILAEEMVINAFTELQKENEALNKKLFEAVQKLAEKQEQYREASIEIDRKHAIILELHQELDQLKAQLAHRHIIGKVYEVSAESINHLAGELDELKKEFDALKEKHAEVLSYLPKVPMQPYEQELAQRCNELQKELDTLASALSLEQQAHVDTAKRMRLENEKLTAELQELKSARRREVRADMADELKRLQTKLQAAQAEIEQWKKRDADSMADLNAATSELQAAKDEVTGYRKLVTDGPEGLKQMIDAYESVRSAMLMKHRQLTEQNEIYKTALEYYAAINTPEDPGSWAMRKRFLFDLIDISDLEEIGPEYGTGKKKMRYVFGGKTARQALADAEALETITGGSGNKTEALEKK